MAPKSKAKVFHALSLGRSLALSGGFAATRSFVPEARMFPFTRAGGDAAGSGPVMLECVRLGNKESWLCEIAAGMAVFHRPLNRLRVFSDLMQAMIADCEDKKMASLAFDDEDSEAVETPRKARAPSRERRKKESAKKKRDS